MSDVTVSPRVSLAEFTKSLLDLADLLATSELLDALGDVHQHNPLAPQEVRLFTDTPVPTTTLMAAGAEITYSDLYHKMASWNFPGLRFGLFVPLTAEERS